MEDLLPHWKSSEIGLASSLVAIATAEDVASCMNTLLHKTEWVTADWVEHQRMMSAEFMEALKERNEMQSELGNPQPTDDDDLPSVYRDL